MKEQIIKEITEKVMVKLEAHKVELGLIDDIENESKAYINKADKNLTAFYKIQNEFRPYINEGNSILSKIQKVEKSAKELGLDLPNKITQISKDIEELLKELKDNA